MIQFAQNIESQEYDLLAIKNGKYGIHDHLRFKETHLILLHCNNGHMGHMVTFIHLFIIAFCKHYKYLLPI